MSRSDSLRVMPLGDSITRGKGGSSWRHYLRNLLKAEGIQIQYVGSSPHAPNFCEPWSDHYLALQQALEYNVEHEGWGGLKIYELVKLVDHESYPDITIEQLLEDGIHPNIYGNQKIAKIWSQAIIAFLKQDGL